MNRREFLRSSTAVAGLFATPPLWLCSRGEAKQSCYRPGDEVDPRFRLLDNSNEHEHVPAYGSTYPWQGRFKWSEDEQRYGTPTIWLLDGRLRVIRTPFWETSTKGCRFRSTTPCETSSGRSMKLSRRRG